jgi:hypothetical protein
MVSRLLVRNFCEIFGRLNCSTVETEDGIPGSNLVPLDALLLH